MDSADVQLFVPCAGGAFPLDEGDCMLRWFNREDALYIIATAYIIAVGGWAVYVLARYFVG